MESKPATGIMLILLLMSFLPWIFGIQLVKAEPRTWYVDDDGGMDFTRIQDAINAASSGDTIFVYNGTYHEHLAVGKENLTIIGEDNSNTVVDGGGGGAVVNIWADRIAISRFTVRNGGWGWYYDEGSAIYLERGKKFCRITGNIVTNARYGLGFWRPINSTIERNHISSTSQGISFDGGNYNTVIENTISDTDNGMALWYPYQNTIQNNTISNSGQGLYSSNGIGNNFSGNTITGNTFDGIALHDSSNNSITGTVFADNGCGIWLSSSSNNIIYHNSFLNNDQQVFSSTSNNTWDSGYPSGGNYWSDYTDVDVYCGPHQDMVGRDGIWDHPHVIDASNTDEYPLSNPHVPGNLSVSVYTDKSTYNAGDAMQLGLNITNPDRVKYLCFAVWVTLPDSSTYLYRHEHAVLLPIGTVYSNPTFRSITLPSLPSGTYTWHAAFLERATHTTLVEATAEWEFS